MLKYALESFTGDARDVESDSSSTSHSPFSSSSCFSLTGGDTLDSQSSLEFNGLSVKSQGSANSSASSTSSILENLNKKLHGISFGK